MVAESLKRAKMEDEVLQNILQACYDRLNEPSKLVQNKIADSQAFEEITDYVGNLSNRRLFELNDPDNPGIIHLFAGDVIYRIFNEELFSPERDFDMMCAGEALEALEEDVVPEIDANGLYKPTRVLNIGIKSRTFEELASVGRVYSLVENDLEMEEDNKGLLEYQLDRVC